MSNPLISHGRGGAANISEDSQPYTDGAIVREGPYGDQEDGPYSTGRGGEGNIGSPRTKPTSKLPHDQDVIPETALRRDQYQDFHVGRGGEGNQHHEHGGAKHGHHDKHATVEGEQVKEHKGLGDKIKGVFGKKD